LAEKEKPHPAKINGVADMRKRDAEKEVTEDTQD
jgi:hypothetical protein